MKTYQSILLGMGIMLLAVSIVLNMYQYHIGLGGFIAARDTLAVLQP